MLNQADHLVILASTVTGCASISALASLVGITVGISSSAITIKISVITARITKSKSKIKKNNFDTIVFLAKTNLNTIEILISKALIDSNISHDKFVSVNKVLKEYNDTKQEMKTSNDK